MMLRRIEAIHGCFRFSVLARDTDTTESGAHLGLTIVVKTNFPALREETA